MCFAGYVLNCSQSKEVDMIQARDGDRVKVHYTGKLGDGRVLRTSEGGPPLEVNIGSGGHIRGLEKGLIGMQPGETKTIVVPPEEGHGPKQEDLIVSLPKTDFPESITPAVGKRVRARKEGGGYIEMSIKEIDEDTVTLDANHPLAGEILVFEVQLVEVI
jgi:FKBP-type peptidyl-prolyl cis-trans isomerase 2